MIVGSLLLILGAVALLAFGLVRGSNAYLVGSIAVSLLAAVTLVVGSRQAASTRVDGPPARGRDRRRGTSERDEVREERDEVREEGRMAADEGGRRHSRREPATELLAAVRGEAGESGDLAGERAGRGSMVAVQEPAIPVQSAAADVDRSRPVAVDVDESDDPDDGYDDEEPPDEPVAQQVSGADAARVGRMSTAVLVIDGRPRYHLPGCVHLLGRDSEPLPVHEAVELGFTPCGLCEPDSALLAEARRV